MWTEGGLGPTAPDVNATWDGVRDRLERLRLSYMRGQAREVFGAEGHRFEALPPLSDGDLARAENQFGVRLPEDYRDFLTRVSAGGAGPYYGLFPLSPDAAGRWSWRGDGAELTTLAALGTAFDPGDVSEALALLDETPPPMDDEEVYEDWLNHREDVLWDDKRTRGAVCLCHEGCAYRDWLVVTGPHQGQIWDDERAGDVDLAPKSASDGQHVDLRPVVSHLVGGS